jgi:hypothetical protein
MGWAAAIPIAMQVIGSMTESEEKPQGPAIPPPPTLGEIFAENAKNYQPMQHSMPSYGQTQNTPVGGGQR